MKLKYYNVIYKVQRRRKKMTDFVNVSQFDRAMLEDYERHLRMGKNMPKTYFNGCSDAVKNGRAVLLFKYFFEKVVEWTPLEIINYLTKDVIDNKAKLSKAYSAVDFPKEFSKKDYFYIAKLCYPDEIGYMFNYRDLIILRYKKVLESGKTFPKKFFDTPDGNDKARIIMQYALLTSDIKFRNIDDLCEYFSHRKTSDDFLSKAKLKNVCAMNFTSPLEFAYYSLSPTQRDRAYYMLHKLDNSLKQHGIQIP